MSEPSRPKSDSDEIRRYIDSAVRQPCAGLLEQRRDVAVARTRVPGAVGEIERLVREVGRVRQDHVELLPRRHRREQIRAHRAHASVEAVGARIVERRARGIRIDVDRHDAGRARPRRRERDDARAGSDVGDALTLEIEALEEAGEELAGEEEARMKHRRPHHQLEPGRAHDRGAAPLQDEMIGEEMGDVAK